MKRIGFFLLWALMFWAFALMAGSQISIGYQSVQAQRNIQARPDDFRKILQVSLHSRQTRGQVSLEFIRRYWRVTLACATLLAGIGSVAGGLPGTGKPKTTEPPPLPPP